MARQVHLHCSLCRLKLNRSIVNWHTKSVNKKTLHFEDLEENSMGGGCESDAQLLFRAASDRICYWVAYISANEEN
jgi:hypothetical protein